MKLAERLTDARAAKLELPPGRSDEVWWDLEQEGFGLRGRRQKRPPHGITKRWWFQAKDAAGRTHKESLGDPRRIKVTAAREIARRRAAALELGEDLTGIRNKAKAERKAEKLKFGALVERYLLARGGDVWEPKRGGPKAEEPGDKPKRGPKAKKPKPKLRRTSFKTAAYCLRKLAKPLHAKSAGAIGLETAAEFIDAIERERGARSASLARRNLITLLNWGMRRGLVSANPFKLTEDPAGDIGPRKRKLSDEELGIIWRACEGTVFGRIVRLLILTACRRNEIGGLRHDELDLVAGVLTIPPERVKNNQELRLHLPEAALEILRSVPRVPGQPFLFGARPGRGFGRWSDAKQRLDLKIAASAGRVLEPSWCLHDLRRTARSNLSKLGVRPDICERALNHTPPELIRTYDQHDFSGEVGAALETLANHVLAIVEGRSSTVVPMLRHGT